MSWLNSRKDAEQSDLSPVASVEDCILRGENLKPPRNYREYILYFFNYIWLVRDIRQAVDDLDKQMVGIAQGRDDALKILGQSALQQDVSDDDFVELVARYQETLTQLLSDKSRIDERLAGLKDVIREQKDQRQASNDAHDGPIKALKDELAKVQEILAGIEAQETPDVADMESVKQTIHTLKGAISTQTHAKEKALKIHDEHIAESESEELRFESARLRLERRQDAVTQDLGRDIILNSPSAGRSSEAQAVFRQISQFDKTKIQRTQLDDLINDLDPSPVYRVSITLAGIVIILILLGGWII